MSISKQNIANPQTSDAGVTVIRCCTNDSGVRYCPLHDLSNRAPSPPICTANELAFHPALRKYRSTSLKYQWKYPIIRDTCLALFCYVNAHLRERKLITLIGYSYYTHRGDGSNQNGRRLFMKEFQSSCDTRDLITIVFSNIAITVYFDYQLV